MIRVLFVDDVRGILNVAKILLAREGIETETAASGKEALERLEKGRFDAIVSDYLMPGMTGIDFLKTIRGKGDNTPFILFTGRGREEVVTEAFDSGTDFYLPKVGKPEAQFVDLSYLIKRAVQKRQPGKTSAEIKIKIKNAGAKKDS